MLPWDLVTSRKNFPMLSCLRSPVLLLGITLAGCGGSSSDRDPALRTVIRDSAGIRIVDNVLPPEPIVWRRMADAPSVLIPPGEGDDALLRVAGAERMTNGSFLVATLLGSPLMRFGPDGRFQGVLAVRGSGPGELRSIDGFFRRGTDTLVVWDPRQARLSTFTPEGLVESRSLVGRVQVTLAGVAGEFAPGHLLLRERGAPGPLMQGGDGVARDTTVFLLLRTDADQPAESLVILPGLKVILLAHEVAGRMIPGMAASLDNRDAWAVAGGGRGFVVNADDVDIRVLDSTGLRERWTLAVPPVPIGDTEISAMKATLAEIYGETVLPFWEPIWASVPPPSVRPVVAGVLRSRDGTLWVERYSLVTDSIRLYHVFDANGAHVGEVTVPRGFKVLSADRDWVLGVSRDEDGLESVELYSLIEPTR